MILTIRNEKHLGLRSIEIRHFSSLQTTSIFFQMEAKILRMRKIRKNLVRKAISTIKREKINK